jgi:hypothetical protein
MHVPRVFAAQPAWRSPERARPRGLAWLAGALAALTGALLLEAVSPMNGAPAALVLLGLVLLLIVVWPLA